MNLGKKLLIVGVMVLAMCGLVGCGTESSNSTSNNQPSANEEQKLHIYCDESIQKPFQEIVDAFKAKSNTDIQVVFANAADIQTQIKTSQEGDFFIASSGSEVKPVEEFVAERKTLVEHIPVLAVQAGNPKNIHGLQDLTKSDIKVVTNDPKSTQIGKIAQQAFIDEEIINNLNVISNTTSAEQMTNALITKEADAVITWKENCNVDGVEVVKTPDMEPYIKNIPIARLKFNSDNKIAPEFEQFLDSDEAHNIWIKCGYEIED